MTERRFKVGGQVKLTGIPPAVEEDRKRFPETYRLFKKAVGRIFDVRGVDKYGHIELWLSDDGSESRTGSAHSIWVEPEFLGLPIRP